MGERNGFPLGAYAEFREALRNDDLVALRTAMNHGNEWARVLSLPTPVEMQTPLETAASISQTAIVEEIATVSAGICDDAKRGVLDRALSRRRGRGRLGTVKLLLDLGASPFGVDAFGHTPIYGAAANGCSQIIELLATRLGIAQLDTCVPSPLMAALLFGQCDSADALLKLGCRIDIFAALLLRDRDRVVQLLKADPELQFTPLHGFRWDMAVGPLPLHVAVLSGDIEMMTAVLDSGADVNAVTENGLSAVTLAQTLPLESFGGNQRGFWRFLGTKDTPRAMMAELQRRGAQPSATILFGQRDRLRETLAHDPESAENAFALLMAIWCDDETLVEIIVNTIGVPSAPLHSTPLAACTYKKQSICERLIEAGANVNDEGALMGVMSPDNAQQLSLLMQAGADPDFLLRYQYLLHEAAENGAVQCAEVLIKAGAAVSHPDRTAFGLTPLHVAAISEKPNTHTVAQILRNAGADLYARDTVFDATPREWLDYASYPQTPDRTASEVFTAGSCT